MRKFAFAAMLAAAPAYAQPVVNADNPHYAINSIANFYAGAGDIATNMAFAKKNWHGQVAPVALTTASPFRMFLEYRGAPTPPMLHQKEAQLIHVEDGLGMVMIGGTLKNPKPGKDGNVTGAALDGGQVQMAGKGAFLMIPAGMPYQVTSVNPAIGFTITTVYLPLPGQ